MDLAISELATTRVVSPKEIVSERKSGAAGKWAGTVNEQTDKEK